jgi:phosphate acetyltransferase
MARLGAEGICEPLALGDVTEAQVQALVMARGMKEVMARRLLKKPLYRAAAMVAAGEADAMVAGADSPTRRVIEAAAMAIGPAEGVNTASSFFVMLFPDGREMIFADCALNLEPSAEELADIARASHASAKALLGHSEVAMLSFSTGTSGAGESVERVRTASELAGFVGPVQGDAALNPKVATKKGMGAGNANVLIFPSLDAGNIAYKLAQELAGAQALGPILQGFAKPVGDLSRGATVEDIVAVSAIVVALG